MGEIRKQRPVLLVAAVSSRYESAIDQWSRSTMCKQWGEIVLESPMFEFNETSFYTASMGADLKKKLFAFEPLIDPADLSSTKILANDLEQQFIDEHEFPEQRPLNIDPGYITEAKLVLATTKDRDHRLYLKDGIFAEVTLFFKQGVWECSRWTYPDYKRPDFHKFFERCRQYLRKNVCNGMPLNAVAIYVGIEQRYPLLTGDGSTNRIIAKFVCTVKTTGRTAINREISSLESDGMVPMTQKETVKTLSFILSILVFLAGAVFLIGCNPTEIGSVSTISMIAIDDEKEAAKEQKEKEEDLLKEMEKPAFALFVTGRQKGYIEPCGCTGLYNQKGGLMRRHRVQQLLTERGWDLIPIDAGNQIKRFGQQPVIKLRHTFEGLCKVMNYAAVGFGPGDLKIPSIDLLQAMSDVADEDGPFVCANVDPLGAGLAENFDHYRTSREEDWNYTGFGR